MTYLKRLELINIYFFKNWIGAVVATIVLNLLLTESAIAQDISAEMQKVKVNFSLNSMGSPLYSVLSDQKVIIKPSLLGFTFINNDDFSANFQITGSEKGTLDETWKPLWGQSSEIRNHYNEVRVHLRQKKTDRILDIVFRVFADGVGFRYEFPKQANIKYFIVENELTHFNLAGNHKAFWIPGDYDTSEYPYTTSHLSEINNKELVEKSTAIAVRVAPDRYAVQTPLMLKTDDGLYINIQEAALINYPAMQLHVNDTTYELSSSLVPDAVGNKAYLHAPFHTPWRTVIVSDKATDILSSNIILNLNNPSEIKNSSWITPMKFVGVWWEMQTAKGTWNYSDYPDSADANGQMIPNNRHSANAANVKKYIDFAAKNGIKGVLVEGWNTGWEDWFGNWKENVFDFVTPYPDFNVKAIEEYAASKGVEMIMHNETSGSATNYERQIDTAFKFMNEFGYKAVKTGYVGKIIPRVSIMTGSGW